MKNKIFIGITSVALFMTSCGDADSGKEGEGEKDPNGQQDPRTSNEADLTGLREFDMTPYDLNAIIYIPEKYYTDENQEQKFEQPVITHNEGEAEWTITMKSDKNFNLVITDWGDIAQSVADKKQQHVDENTIYDYKYEEETEEYMLYSRVLKSENTTLEDVDMTTLPTHHCYVVKVIDGMYITGETNTMGDFYKVSAKTMMNCVRGMKSTL